MKKILLAFFILIGFSVSGQVLQAPNVYGYQFRRVGGDTLLFIPGDTLQVPATYNSKTFIARKGTSLYYWNGSAWVGIGGGGSTDTTSLSNRINLKLNISDTAAMLSPYVRSNIYTADGTLTGNRIVSLGSNNITFSGTGQFQAYPSQVELNPSDGFGSSYLSMIGTNMHLAAYNTGFTKESEMFIYDDSVKINPHLGQLNIDSLRSTTDTTTFKPLVYGGGGQVRRFTNWPVGGASGITSLNSQTGATQTFATGRGISVSSSSNVHTFTLQNDTTTLLVFGGGSGASSDTSVFSTDALYGSAYIDVDTFVVTKIVAVIQAGATDTLGIQIYYNDSLNTGTVGVATSTLALTSQPQGHSTTTLSNATIPPGSFIWCKSPTVVAGRKPEYLSVSLIGYRKRRI